jgi:hypothetical protein
VRPGSLFEADATFEADRKEVADEARHARSTIIEFASYADVS